MCGNVHYVWVTTTWVLPAKPSFNGGDRESEDLREEKNIRQWQISTKRNARTHSSQIADIQALRSEKGLTLETLALATLYMMANLHYQLWNITMKDNSPASVSIRSCVETDWENRLDAIRRNCKQKKGMLTNSNHSTRHTLFKRFVNLLLRGNFKFSSRETQEHLQITHSAL